MWVNEGQQKWYNERVTTVVLGGMRLMAVYQPSIGMDEMAAEVMREEVERQMRMSRNERVIIGGDFNANVGRNEERPGVCGKYGIGVMNEAGRNLIEWCEENELAYVNSYMRHARRGTWLHMRYGRWYELDGFVVRKNERQRMVRKMWTMDDGVLSDHRPKCMRVKVNKKRWRNVRERERRVPRIKWECLKEEGKKEEYMLKTSELMRDEERGEREGEWKRLSDVMTEAAKDVCGVVTREVVNPWVIGHEGELDRIRDRVKLL